MHRHLLRASIISTVCLLAEGVRAQGASALPYTISVTGRILSELDGEPIKGAMIMLQHNGEPGDLVRPNGRGRYAIDLRRGQTYELVYSAPGQVAKRVLIDTHGAPPLLDVPSITMTVDITLFPPLDGMDTGIFLEPLGKAAYKHSVRNIVWDKEYGEAKRAELRRYMAGYDQKTNGPFVTGTPPQ